MLAFATSPSPTVQQPTLSRFPRNKPIISVVPDPLHPSTRRPSVFLPTSSPATLMLDQHKLDALITNIRAGKYRLPTYGLPPGITPGANPEAEKLYHMTLAVRDVAGGTPVPQAIVQIPEHQRAILSKEVPTTSLLEASNLIAKYERQALGKNALFDQLRRLMKLSSPTMAEDMIRLIGEAKPAAGSNSSTAIHSDKNVGIKGFNSESDQSTLLHGFSGQRSVQRLMGKSTGEADMTRINLIVGAARNVLESVESFVSKRWKYRGDPRDLRGLSFAQITAHQAAHSSQWTYSAESGVPPSIDALLKASTFGYQGGKEKAAGRELPTDRPDPLNPFEDKDSGRDASKSWNRDKPFIYEGKDNERLRQGIETMLGSDLIQKDPKIRRLLEGAYSHPEMRKTLEHYAARTGSPALLQEDQERVIANLVNSRKDTVLREDLLASAARIVSSGGFSSSMLEAIRESAAKVGYQKLVELIDTYHDPNFFHSDERGVALSASDMAYIERHHPREAKLIASLIGGGTSSSNLSDPRVRERIAQLPYAMGAVLRTIKTADQAQRMGIPLAQSQFSPFVTEMAALSYKLENGGVLDPMALHSSVEGAFMRQSPDVSHAFLPGAQIGTRSFSQGRLFAGVLSPQELAPFIQSEGAGVGLEGYERRLEDLLRHHAQGRVSLPYGQAVPAGVDPLAAGEVKLSPEQVEHYQAELAQVQRLRGTLHDPSFQLQAGHYLNIVHRAATGKSAIDYSLRGKDDLQPYQRFMAPLNNQYREGARTLGSIEELVDALQGGIGRLQGFGGIESDEVDRVMAALGHDPASNEFVLGKPRSLLPSGKTYHAARLARQFPDEEADLLAQFTRSPFQEGQTVAFMGGMPGFTDETRRTRGAGLEPGTVGTLHPIQQGINFGLTQNYGMFWENAMFTQEEYTRHKGKLYKGNPWLQQPAEPMAMLRTRNGRRVPVRMSQVSDLQAKGLFSTSQAMLDRTRLRANLYASGAVERRRMRRQGMSLKTGGGARAASSPSFAVPPRLSKETRPLPIVSKGYASMRQVPPARIGRVALTPKAKFQWNNTAALPPTPLEASRVQPPRINVAPNPMPAPALEEAAPLDQLGSLRKWLTSGNPVGTIPPPSSEQLAFMQDPASRVVLEGGPGTGKTATAVRRTMHSVASGSILPKNVLGLSAIRSAVSRIGSEFDQYQGLLPAGKDYHFPVPRTFASVAASTILRAMPDENEQMFYPVLQKLGYGHLTGTILSDPTSEDLAGKDPDVVMRLQQTGQKAFIAEQVNNYLTSHGRKPYRDQQISDLQKYITEVKKGRGGQYSTYVHDLARGQSDLSAGILSEPAALHLYEQGMRQRGLMDWDDLLSIAVEAYQKFGPDALPDVFKGIEAVLIDEGQDVTPVMAALQQNFIGALSANNPQVTVAMDVMQSLTQGMGGIPMNEVRGAYKNILGLPPGAQSHQLTQNFRSDAGTVALHNALLDSPHLANTPRSPRQVSKSGNLGSPTRFSLGQTQPDVYRKMFRSMLGRTDVSTEDIRKNIAAGVHPFTGATTKPNQIAAILPRNQDVDLFEHVARQELQQSFGLAPREAHAVLQQITHQGMPSPSMKKGDPEWERAQMQMPLLKFMGSRGQEYTYPYLDASFTGLWQRNNDIEGHMRNLNVGMTRTSKGGQLTVGAAQYPFTRNEAQQYIGGRLDLNNPDVMDRLTRRSRKNAFESFQGQQVPRFFRDLQGGTQSQLRQWGYNPDLGTKVVDSTLAPSSSSSPSVPDMVVNAKTVKMNMGSGSSLSISNAPTPGGTQMLFGPGLQPGGVTLPPAASNASAYRANIFGPPRRGGPIGRSTAGIPGGGPGSSGSGDDEDIIINATGSGGGRRGGGGGRYGGASGAANFGRTMARIGYELQFVGQYLGTIVDQAIAQGSEYRRATVPLTGSGTSGTEGFYNFANTGQGISAFQRNTLPMYSTTQIAQGLHTFTGLTGYQGASPPLGALTDISAMAAMSGMDPTALMGPMAYLNGSSGRGSIQGSYTKLAGQLSNLFGGNLSEENLSPTLQALTQIVPTLQGLNPMGGSQTGQALSFFQLAQNAGMTPQNFGDVSSMLGNLSQVGSSPNLQQQYTLQQLGYNMTGAPQLAQYQQEETGRQEQLAQLHLMQNINGKGLSLPQLSIQIDQAQIRMDEANLVMSGIQLQQAQVSLQGQQLQYQYGQASYGFNLAQQNALYGPIGGDYSRLAGYSFQQNQLVSQRNFMSPEIGTMFTPQGVSGLRNQEFYAGLQNQQQSLILGRSPLLSDALFQQQMKYIAEQASFYKQELALRNQQREFDRVWQKRLLDQQGAQVAMQAKAVAYQGYIYGLQQQQFKLEKQKIQYDEKQAQIQQDFLGRQASDLQNIDTNITQFLQGKGPVAGQNLQPDQLVQNLADQLKSGALNPQSLQDTIRTLVSDPTSQGMLFQLVSQLASQPQTLSQMEQGLGKTDDKQLLDMFNKLKQSGAFTDMVQKAGQANAYLQYAGTGADWQGLVGGVNAIAQTLPELAKDLSPTSSLALGISTIANVIGPLSVGIGALYNILGLLLNKGGFPGISGGGGNVPGIGARWSPGPGPNNLPGGPNYTDPAAYQPTPKAPPGTPGGGNIPFMGAGLTPDQRLGDVVTINGKKYIASPVDPNILYPLIPDKSPGLFARLGQDVALTTSGTMASTWDRINDPSVQFYTEDTGHPLNLKALSNRPRPTPTVLTQGQAQYFAHDTSHAPPVMTQGQSQYFTHDSSSPGPSPVQNQPPLDIPSHRTPGGIAEQTAINAQYANNSNTSPSSKEMNQHLQGMEVRMKQQYDTSTQTQTNTNTANLLAKTVADRNKVQDDLRTKQAQWFLDNQKRQIALQQQQQAQLIKSAGDAHKDAGHIVDAQKSMLSQLLGGFTKGTGGTAPMGHPGFTTPHVNAEFHQKMNYGIHQGVDFAAAQGTPIGAFNAGRVKNTGFYPWGGEVDVDIGHGLTERYLHLSQIGVVRGQPLLPRQRMGLTGGGTAASGLGYWSSGAHSHVQIDTGTYGSGIDPWPIWALTGARDISNFYGSPGWASNKGGARGGALRQLHDGGVAMRRVISEIGDGNEPEAVVPLSRLSTLLEQQSTRQRGQGSPSLSSSPTHSVTVQKLADKFEVHVHTTQSKLDDQAVDDLGAQLFDILTESLQKLTGK